MAGKLAIMSKQTAAMRAIRFTLWILKETASFGRSATIWRKRKIQIIFPSKNWGFLGWGAPEKIR